MSQRSASAVLAASGLVTILLAGGTILLIPGVLIWICWILISVGVRSLQIRFFWAISAVWNIVVSAILLSFTDFGLKERPIVYWDSRIHSILAVVLSIFVWWSLRRENGNKEKQPNHLLDPTSPSVTPPAGAGGAPSVAADH